MIGRYALPSDDLARLATSVTASAEVSAYGAVQLISENPGRPSKQSTSPAYWDLTFASPITVSALHLVYPNFDEGLDVTLEPDGGTPITIPIPAQWENGWWPSPWLEFDPQTSDQWRLSINDANSLLPQVGRLLLYESIRDLTNDVRWGVIEDEEQGQIEHLTDAQVETVYELFGPRRSFVGELALMNDTAAELISLFRDARNRVKSWTLIPDVDVPEAWLVRFSDVKWSRTREMIEHNIFPFGVKELSRGLPWP